MHGTYQRINDKELKKQAGWYLRPYYAPSSERPQFRIPLIFDHCMPPVQSEYPAERRAAAAVPLPESP